MKEYAEHLQKPFRLPLSLSLIYQFQLLWDPGDRSIQHFYTFGF